MDLIMVHSKSVPGVNYTCNGFTPQVWKETVSEAPARPPGSGSGQNTARRGSRKPGKWAKAPILTGGNETPARLGLQC